MSGVLNHVGGRTATLDDLASIPIPSATAGWAPVPYRLLVDEVKLQLPNFGMRVTGEDYSLTMGGNRMFGVLDCEGRSAPHDYCKSVGVRASYDQSFPIGMAAGSCVAVCDNLAFYGEAMVELEGGSDVPARIPSVIGGLLEEIAASHRRCEEFILRMKETSMDDSEALELIVAAVRSGALRPGDSYRAFYAWQEPEHEEFRPRTAWSLFNAATSVVRDRGAEEVWNGTLRLTEIFSEALVPVG